MPVLPMFPLGTVLFPHMPLRLRVFEERYLVMLQTMLEAQSGEFGVVLIERGQEVGGGEHRFGTGTVADVGRLSAEDGMVGLVAHGARRFEVVQWLDDDPYPRAEVRDLPELAWDEAHADLRRRAEAVVRRTLAEASEFAELAWPADVELAAEPLASCWQLAGIALVGALDQLRLLRSPSVPELLETIIAETESVAAGWRAPWPEP